VYPDKLFKKQYKPKIKTYPFFESFLIKEALKKVKLKWKKFFKKGDKDKENFSEKEEQHMKRIFSKIETISKEKNIPVVVAYLSNENPAPRTQLAKRIVTEKGLHFIDVTTSFHGTNVSDYKIYAIDSHPNEKANKIFADTIYNYLKNMGFPASYRFDDS
jgi:hypothetical protein